MNILVILCDQLSSKALNSYGNTYDSSIHMNQLVNEGVSFEQAYTPCPLCQPARASIWSSKYPHQTGVLSNLPDQGFLEFPKELPTFGDVFKKAGYECVHFGKRHDYGSLRGFDLYEEKQIVIKRDQKALNYDYETFLDENTTSQTEYYFANNRFEAPFVAVVDLQNPHNICSYIGENKDGHQFPPGVDLPELPKNFITEDIENRPPFIQYACCAHRRQSQVVHWGSTDYQHYLYAYHQYIQVVDKQVGRVLKALEASGQKEDTLIVFTADHGEGMAAHGFVTKYGNFYNESNEVPLSFVGPGIVGGQRFNEPVSLLDLIPTLADICDIKAPATWEGRSLGAYLKKDIGQHMTKTNEEPDHKCIPVVAQWFDEFEGYQVPGRMFLDDQYKYIVYRDYDKEGEETTTDGHEELYKRDEDPYEEVNLAYTSGYETKLQYYRNQLEEYCLRTNDNFHQLKAEYDKKYRQHRVGLCNHTGDNAVLDYAKTLK